MQPEAADLEACFITFEATPGVSVYHNINSFHLKARLNEELFVRAVRHVVERHDIFRTSVQPVELLRATATGPQRSRTGRAVSEI